jgi:colicin import membrane protein
MDARPSAMDASGDRPEFAPPPREQQVWRGLGLAVLAHALLLVALTHGLQWQRESENAAVEAELWSALPHEAAPKPVPAPVPAPVPVPPPPPPPPIVRAPPAPEPPVARQADIALEREKQKRELERQHEAELERERAVQQHKLALQKKHEQELALQKKHEQELARKREEQQQAKLVAEAKRKELEAKAAQDAKLREQIRKEMINRSLAMAGTGAPSSTGTAAHSSGPSASWGAKVQARVRPNIVFADAVEGNPKAEVEVRTSPDGTIVGKRLVHSSGVKSWDEAVLRALDRTESLPRDVDGRVPSPVIIAFRPHD